MRGVGGRFEVKLERKAGLDAGLWAEQGFLIAVGARLVAAFADFLGQNLCQNVFPAHKSGEGQGAFFDQISERAADLLERKALILSRIKSLVGEKRVENLKDLVATVADPSLRDKIENEMSELAKQASLLAEQEAALSQAQSEQIAKRDDALSKLRAELFERRLRAWTGFLAKESMATYIGAFLLVVVTFVQIVALFLGSNFRQRSSTTRSFFCWDISLGRAVCERLRVAKMMNHPP